MKLVGKRWFRRLLAIGALGLFAGIAFTLYIGNQLVAAAPRHIGPPPSYLGGETVRFNSASGSQIVGWLTEAENASGTVLLLHAIRADRRSMASRARFLRDQGYHTLCIDFQAHGESPGEKITLGYLEAMDAAAGVAYLRSRYATLPVAVVGTSLGGASALMAQYVNPPEAMVVESVFADAKTGVGNRLDMRLGRLGRLLTPLLTWQIQPLLGIDADRLNSVRAAENVVTPVFVLYGSEDRHARPAEANAIYAALSGPKEIWQVCGASHVDLYGFAGAEYEERVSEFIEKHLREIDDESRPRD